MTDIRIPHNDIPLTMEERYNLLLKRYKEYDKSQKEYISNLERIIDELQYIIDDKEAEEKELEGKDLVEGLRAKIQAQREQLHHTNNAINAAKNPHVEELLKSDKCNIIADNIRLSNNEAILRRKVKKLSEIISDLINEKLHPNDEKFDLIIHKLETMEQEELSDTKLC